MDEQTCWYCINLSRGNTPCPFGPHNELQRDDEEMAGVPGMDARLHNMGREPLSERVSKESAEGSRGLKVEINLYVGSVGDSLSEQAYRAIQYIGHADAWRMETGVLRDEVLRWVQSLGWTPERSDESFRVEVTVRGHHDTEAEA